MKFLRIYLPSIVYAILLAVSMFVKEYDVLIYTLVGTIFITVLNKLGKGIILRELMALHSVFTCLLMPLIGFNVYNKNNELAVLWVRYMPVNELTFFSFCFPALTAFTLAITFPYKTKGINDHEYVLLNLIPRIKKTLIQGNLSKKGLMLVVFGSAMYFVAGVLPPSVRFISLIMYFSSFAGILYVYFSPAFKYKKLVIGLFAAYILLSALRSSMFTVVVYMGITLSSILFAGSRLALWKKIAFFLVSGYFLLILQSIKPAYRAYTWRSSYQGSKIELFYRLAAERVEKGDILTSNSFFPIYYRTNQGFNIALVMRRIPSIQEFDYGEVMVRNLASTVVPRILWPTKPEAGGKFNMRYYAGANIKGFSTNIGPLGEAYGGFGLTGGIVFMFFLGFAVRGAIYFLLKISSKHPLMLLWLPVLFYQATYSAETDTLQIFNSLIKSAFFIWLLVKITPELFGIMKGWKVNLANRRKHQLLPSR